MARLERYVDNLNGNDSWDGTSPVYQGGTVGPWLTIDKACGTNPGTGNYFVVYLKNNNDLTNGIARPYYRTGSYLFNLRYSGLSLSEPMEFHCNGAWLSAGFPLTNVTWEKVPGTSYVYRAYVSSISTGLAGMYAWHKDYWFGPNKGPRPVFRYTALADTIKHNVPWDGVNYSFYWDSTNRYLYFCDRNGNPNLTGIYLEYQPSTGGQTHHIYCNTSSIKYHRFVNGIFYNCNTRITGAVYEGLSFERCYLLGDVAYEQCVGLPLNSKLWYCFALGRSTSHATNAVIRVEGANVQVHNNLIFGSNYGLRLYSGTSATAYNNIFLNQDIAAIKYDGTYRTGLTENYNYFGSLELQSPYGLAIGQLPAANDVYQFPGNTYGIFDKVFRYTSGGFTDVTSEAANDDASDFNLMGTSTDYIYFGSSAPFNGLLMELRTNGSYSGLKVEYYSGSGGWTSVVSLRGQTALDTQGCVLAWSMPSNWFQTSVNGVTAYWIRLSASTVTTMGVAKYARINGSVKEFFGISRDYYNLIPTNQIVGYNWGYQGLDLAGVKYRYAPIGPYQNNAAGLNAFNIEIEC